MNSSFDLNFPGSSADFVVNANKAIKTNGGVFTGDITKGVFSLSTLIGSVKGNYEVLANSSNQQTKIAITITQKPALVPLSKIQKVIEGYF